MNSGSNFNGGASALVKRLLVRLGGVVSLAVSASLLAACGNEAAMPESVSEPASVSLKPMVTHGTDPVNGRSLFVEKGCVICHSVNGVGGKAAPAMDAQIGAPAADPLDFAARMWRGAPAMIELQSIELGYTIYLTGDEIADLAAFAADREAQKSLTVESLPEGVGDSLLDERFWEVEDWDDFLREGQEGQSGDDLPVEPDGEDRN